MAHNTYLWDFVVMVASFITQFVFSMTSRTYGVIYVEILDRFPVSAANAASIGMINFVLFGIGGPIASQLSNRFSHRLVIVIGGILCAVGFIIAGYATHISMVYIGVGLIGGMGAAFVQTAGFIGLHEYFVSNKARAVSLSSTGSAVAVALMSPLYPYLKDQYGYQGAMLIFGGVSLHVCISAVVFAPARKSKLIEENIIEECQDQRVNDKGTVEYTMTEKANSTDIEHSVEKKPEYKNSEEKQLVNEQIIYTRNMSIAPNVYSDMYKHTLSGGDAQTPEKVPLNNEDVCTEKEICSSRDLQATESELLNNEKPKCYKNGKLIGFYIVVVFGATSLSAVASFLAALMVDNDVLYETASLVYTAMSVTDVVCRIVVGLLLDTELIRPKRSYIYGAIWGCASVYCLLFPSIKGNVPGYFILAMLAGSTQGTCFAQRITIISDIVGPNKKAVSTYYGFANFAVAMGHLICKPTGGIIRDSLGSYDLEFYIMGSLGLVAVMIYTVIMFVEDRRK